MRRRLWDACQARNLGPGSFGLPGDDPVALILAYLEFLEAEVKRLELLGI